MTTECSYDLSTFAVDATIEIQRLNAQVDLFWNQELSLYQRLGLSDGMHVLDCGCGTGYLLAKLHTIYPALRCTGVEIDDHLVAVARETTIKRQIHECRILQQSVTAIDLPDNCVDFVISRLVLEHLGDPMLALKQVFRVLKPGGKAVFIDNDFDLHERTYPDTPALGELYDAYRRARRADSGNPCIGRELPQLMKRAGFAAVDLHLLAAHSHVVGDAAFLKAEGSGIPVQLVKAGFLPSESLERVTGQWRSMLATAEHSIFRMLFAGVGEKPSPGAESMSSGPSPGDDRVASFESAEAPRTLPETAEEVRDFITEALSGILKAPADQLAPDAPLISLDVDSMAAVDLCNQVEGRWAVTLPMVDVLSGKSINELAELLTSRRSPTR